MTIDYNTTSMAAKKNLHSVAMTVLRQSNKDKSSPSQWEGEVSKHSPRNPLDTTLKSRIFRLCILSVINSQTHFSSGSCPSLSLPVLVILRVYYFFVINLLAWLIRCTLEFFPVMNTMNPFASNKNVVRKFKMS